MRSMDPYQVLGVDKSADKGSIKKAYYKKAKQYHPDTVTDGNKEEAQKKFAEINNAYEVLSDESKRAQYDQFGHMPDDMGGMGGQGFDPSQFQGMEDIFEMFGFGGQQGGRQQPTRGADIHMVLRLPFMDAVNGCVRELKINTKVECGDCGGLGDQKSSSKCSHCKGRGWRTRRHAFFEVQEECSACNGLGTDPCRGCRGTGTKLKTQKVEVKIPAGVDESTTLRIASRGHTGDRGGKRGNLHLQLKVDAHRHFKRVGADIYFTAAIPFTRAILGGTVTVPSLKGEAIVKVPAGCQVGHVLSMREKGIKYPNQNKYGNQYVKFDIQLPKELTPEQQELMRQLSYTLDPDAAAARDATAAAAAQATSSSATDDNSTEADKDSTDASEKAGDGKKKKKGWFS